MTSNHPKKRVLEKSSLTKKNWQLFKMLAIAIACCLGPQAIYAEEVNIYIKGTPTNSAPQWTWTTYEPVNACEILIKNKAGSIIYEGVLNQTLSFTYPNNIVHNESYRANVRCSKDGGLTWGNYSGYSTPIVIDQVAPLIELESFIRTSPEEISFRYTSLDDLSGSDEVHVQIATDVAFNNIVYEGNGSFENPMPEAIYYARAAAIDRAGNRSRFTEPKILNTTNLYTEMKAVPMKAFTNHAPGWVWAQVQGINTYEIEIQDDNAQTLHREVINDNGQFIYNTAIIHGQKFQARVRGSSDHGTTWQDWSALSDVITIDTQSPTIELNRFTKEIQGPQVPVRSLINRHENDEYWQTYFEFQDDSGMIKTLQVQIASDTGFNNLIVDKIIDPKSYDWHYYYDFYPGSTLQGDNYFARVRVVDKAGNISDYTPARRLNTVKSFDDFFVKAKDFTNQPPQWSWALVDGLGLYEIQIEIENDNDELIHQEKIGNTNQFTYTGTLQDGDRIHASIRGSADDGATWTEWVSVYPITTYDIQAPQGYLTSFIYEDNGEYVLDVDIDEASWDATSMQVQVATDPNFEHLVYEKTIKDFHKYHNFDLGPLQSTLYARISLTDRAGNTSPFTPGRAIFTTVNDEALKLFSNGYGSDVLKWWWIKPDSMNAFEIELQDAHGVVIHTEQLENVNHYSYRPPHMTNGEQYSLRIKGSTDHGVTWGEWSTPDTIIVYLIPPSVQLNAFMREYDQELAIYFSIVADGYKKSGLQLQIARDEEFSDIVFDKTSTVYTSSTYEFFEGDWGEGNYFARIQIIDLAGNKSGFTPAIKLTEDLTLSDFNAASGWANQSPQWWWSKNERVKNYEIEVFDQNGNVSAKAEQNQEGYSLRLPLDHGQSYSARIRGQSQLYNTWGGWNDSLTPIVIDLQAPSAQLSSFVHLAENVVEFQYALADDLGPTAYLRIEVATDLEFEKPVFNKVISAIANPTNYQAILAQKGDLYARIAVMDGAGNISQYSQVAQVDTVMTAIPVMYSEASYTKTTPSWSWSDVYNTNAYQIEIQNESYEVVHSEIVGKVNYYSYNDGLVHGNKLRARIRGSVDHGATWGEWSNFSGIQTVDTKPPTLEVLSFMHSDATTAELRYTADGTLSGMSTITVQVAKDEAFNEIIVREMIGAYEFYQPYVIKNLPENQLLYVRILGVDWAGNVSEFTPAAQIDSAVAQIPQFTSGHYTQEAPRWTWEKAYLATDYEIEIVNNEGQVVLEQNIGNTDYFTYTAGFIHGSTYKARVRVSLNHGQTWSNWSQTHAITVDTVAPIPELMSFQYIAEDLVKVVFRVTEETTNITSNLQIAMDEAFTQLVYDQDSHDIHTNWIQTLNLYLPQDKVLYARIKAVDSAGNESDYTPVVATSIAAPFIYWPAPEATVYKPQVEIKGRAIANAKVQMYVDGEAVGEPVPTDNKGDFSTSILLKEECTYEISAIVQSQLGVGEKSDIHKLSYSIPLPVASFVKPFESSTIAGPIQLEVSASDVLGIDQVAFYVDDVLLGTAIEAPYQYQWDVKSSHNGEHHLKAVVTNASGKTVSIEQSIKVDVPPERVTAPPTPYTGQVGSITPAVSYGNQPIHISGKAVDRSSLAAVANRPLKIILSVDGFERRINVVTDATGAFSYNFKPQINDKGTYHVSIVHPDEVDATPQDSFNINRVSFNYGGYKLSATRNHPAQFNIQATASGDVQGLRWIALPDDQPNGLLPKGITVHGGNGIDIAEGKSASMTITLTADDTATAVGTVYLRALSDDSADLIRGILQVDYQLVPAQAFLAIQKNTIQTGVNQGSSVSENIAVTNKGLSAAKNVRAELLDENGQQPPTWIFLANTGEIGTINEGDEVALQVTAQPDTSVADGMYRFKLHLTADGGVQVDAYLSVAVTQSGIGGVRFDVADIYTATLDDNGQPVPGVKGATIKLQNEAVPSLQYQATTENDGTVLLDQLPPGIYLFRVSASNHTETGGRVRIRPGVVTNQHVFLDYQLINIEFGVTETTINDVYDIVLEATYQTQVPAPVVLLEPLSINIGGMQPGEERTGQLTLTNYGLIEAQQVTFTPPVSDSEFKYEFFGDIPATLPPKTRIVIPYRVTALSEPDVQSNQAKTQGGNSYSITPLLERSTRAVQCKSYTKPYYVGYTYECINGEWVKSANGGYYTYLKGQQCTGNGINWGDSGGSGNGGGNSGGWKGNPSYYTPISPTCTPDCDKCCSPDGKSKAN